MAVFRVKEHDIYVEKLAEYTNGILTTCGLYKQDELEPMESGMVLPITFDIEGASELPVNWFELDFCGAKLLDIDFIDKHFVTDKGIQDTVCLYMFS